MGDIALDGKVAIVTGAGRGLGRAEALELARRGARVVVNDHGLGLDGSAEGTRPADQVVAEILDGGGEAVAHHGDVGDWDDAHGLVATALETFGRLDILVNNAGILRDRMIFSMTEEEFDSVVRVHLKGHFCMLRAATAHWRERSKAADGPVDARVVNTASEAFLIGSPGQPNYAAAKAGIVSLTLAVAQSCGRYGVRANAICPRARTRMTEGVFGAADATGADPLAPEHVAPLVAYLASPAAAGISGQVFVAYGGLVGLVAAPELEARFDAPDGHWTVEALDRDLGGHFADRDPRRTFAALSVLRPEPV
jgi:NAD(P)-dependent dehydrogenase (short-subunit alcohol dehydrogenase family)